MSAEVIAVANHKGGVGKSSTAVSLSAGLAHSKWRTLLVDCDAQGNSTSMFLPDGSFENDLYDVLGSGRPAREAIVATRLDGLEVLPSGLSTALLDQELFNKLRREEQLRRALVPVGEDYDVIVLDLAPNLGALVIAALCAATSLVVPTDATRWGLRGVRMFMTWSEALREAEVLTADLLGVVLTKYEARTIVAQEVLAELQASGLPLFDTQIPKRTDMENMANRSVVIGEPGANDDIAAAYAKLTIEVADRVTAAQAERGRHRG